MENRIELPDPLLGQIRRSYPEVMEKSVRAAELLRGLGGWLPESEASFLAAHFGAAELRLAEQGLRRRVVRIGVVCVHGIGTSYLLASQVRKRFGGEAETDVGWWGDSEDWKRFDFLISTTELDAGDVPVVVVTPVLDDGGIQKIKKEVAKFSRREATERTRSDSGFAELCRALEETAGDCASILSSFTVERAPADCDFEALAKLAGYRFADGEKRGRLVYEGLRDREKLSTQVIPELNLILLHCRTDGVPRPLVALIRPEGGRFTHPYLADSRAALVMLIPSSSSRARGELMGSVSAALIQTDDFLEAVRSGDAKEVERHLQGILRDHLGKFVNQHLKG